MSLPPVVSRDEWLVARKELLVAEKAATRARDALNAAGFPDPHGEVHRTSAFLRDGERVFHTYSTYGRGTEQVGGTHYCLDMTALGRQEDWEEPRGRSTGAPRADQAGAGRT
jgi:predicted dithiol-disulfide oxidoreductase (DUF899 family)